MFLVQYFSQLVEHAVFIAPRLSVCERFGNGMCRVLKTKLDYTMHQLKISTRVNTAKLSHGTDDPDSDQVSASLFIFQPSLLPPLLTAIAKAKLPPRLLSYNLTRRITTTSGVLYRKQTVEGT